MSMCRILFGIILLALTSSMVMAQVASETTIITKGKLSEQAAICAAYANVMEKVTLINPKDSQIWQQRRLDITKQWQDYLETQTGQAVITSALEDIVKNYGRWMTDKIFFPDPNSQETVSPSSEESVQQYITTFCPAMFREADTRIAMARPDLYMTKKLEPESAEITDNTNMASANGLTVPHQLSESLIAGRGVEPEQAAPEPTAEAPSVSNQPSQPEQPQVIIQLAAYKLLLHAESGRDVFRLKMADMASPPRLEIEKPLDEDEGYFRVVSLPMGRDDAKATCALLERRQIGCIIRLIE